MILHDILFALAGGVLIGGAASAFLLLHRRIAGISGILGGALTPTRGELPWRISFLAGLVVGGVALAATLPWAFPTEVAASTTRLAIAGVLVGIGTRLGSGCTSGHGICGLGRLSPRSLVATVTFIAAGAVTVAIANAVGG